MKLGNLCGESLQDCRFTPAVFVDGEHHQGEVAARVEAGDDEEGSAAGDVGQRHPGVHINHLQHEPLVQAPIKARLTSAAEFHHVGRREDLIYNSTGKPIEVRKGRGGGKDIK